MTSDYKNMDDKQLLEALNAGYQTLNFKFTYNSKKITFCSFRGFQKANAACFQQWLNF